MPKRKPEKLQFYAWFPVAFRADTQHLTSAERHAYRDILDEIFVSAQDSGSLPDEDRYLARVVGRTVEEWRDMRYALLDGPAALLGKRDGRIYSARLLDELQVAREKSGRAAASAAVRWGSAGDADGADPDPAGEPPESSRDANGMRTHSERIPDGERADSERTQSKSKSETERESLDSGEGEGGPGEPPAASRPAARSPKSERSCKRIPTAETFPWREELRVIAAEIDPEVDARAEWSGFLDYCESRQVAYAPPFLAAWRNRIRNAAKFDGRSRGSGRSSAAAPAEDRRIGSRESADAYLDRVRSRCEEAERIFRARLQDGAPASRETVLEALEKAGASAMDFDILGEPSPREWIATAH